MQLEFFLNPPAFDQLFLCLRVKSGIFNCCGRLLSNPLTQCNLLWGEFSPHAAVPEVIVRDQPTSNSHWDEQ